MILIDEVEWAQQLFGESDLGDARRSARLVNVASPMAMHMGSSLAKSIPLYTTHILSRRPNSHGEVHDALQSYPKTFYARLTVTFTA